MSRAPHRLWFRTARASRNHAHDTADAQRFPAPALDTLPDDIRARILAVQEKSGFVPNVFLTLAHRPDEFRAFFAYHDALMEKDGGLTKAEREMIVVATSGANQCQYCVVAHGAILRIRAKNPLIADQVAINYRKADITPRQKAMLDFAMKVTRAARRRSPKQDFAALARARLQRRRHLGHRRDRRLLRAVEPHGQRHRHAAERRVLSDGTPAEKMTELDWPEILLRLGVATLAGSAIGLNRDLHGNPIGLKTLGIVGLSTATIVLLALQLAEPGKVVDATSRVIQGILTGIGFLGAGVIVHESERFRVRGLTSAACTFLAACLGIVCGAGQWKIVAISLALAFLVLTIGRRIEHRVHRMLGGKDEPHEERRKT